MFILCSWFWFLRWQVVLSFDALSLGFRKCFFFRSLHLNVVLFSLFSASIAILFISMVFLAGCSVFEVPWSTYFKLRLLIPWCLCVSLANHSFGCWGNRERKWKNTLSLPIRNLVSGMKIPFCFFQLVFCFVKYRKMKEFSICTFFPSVRWGSTTSGCGIYRCFLCTLGRFWSFSF